MNAAKAVGKTVDTSGLGLDETKLKDILTELKSVVSEAPAGSLKDVVQSLKNLALT
jgi:hypothetical protein